MHVHTAQARYMLRRTLADLLAQLGEQRFVRIHKSAAVNIAEVKTLSPLFKGDHEVHAAQRCGAAPEPALQGRAVRENGSVASSCVIEYAARSQGEEATAFRTSMVSPASITIRSSPTCNGPA